ncbi:MAG: hypothetical protein NTV54_09660 [Ignavibacteriales bacterium]|nr:hypothetical protein [Ignavibacteriales bacterium]
MLTEVVLPGTIVGDLLHRHMRTPDTDEGTPSSSRMSAFLFLMITMIVITLAGLFTRQVVTTVVADCMCCALGLFLLGKKGSGLEHHYREVFQWGIYWLLLGLFFEAYEGGIKKDHPTLSYYFVMDGLAIAALLGFSVLIDVFKRRRYVSLLIGNGQNPMIAYVGAGAVVLPLMGLTGIDQWIGTISPAPWVGLAKGIFITTMVAIIAKFFTQKRLFWRT